MKALTTAEQIVVALARRYMADTTGRCLICGSRQDHTVDCEYVAAGHYAAHLQQQEAGQ